MILTGKCKEKFLEWYNEPETYFYRLNKTCQNALIIEWFDSVGIYIDVRIEFEDSFVLKTFNSYAEDDYVGNYSNRQEAIKQAIIKVNEIYNYNERTN